MNYERMGIVVSMIVLVGVLGVAAVGSGEFDIDTGSVNFPQINAGTNTNTNQYQQDGFYEYCYRMGLDC